MAALLASACLLAACGSGTEAETAAVLEPLLRDAPPFQRALLEDGELTYAEYERAVLAAVECMRSAGVEVSELQRSEDPPRLSFVFRVPETAGDGLVAAADDCQEEYLIHVQSFWDYVNRPSGETLARKLREAATCLRAAGHDVADDVTEEELQAIVMNDPDATECIMDMWGHRIEMPVFPSDPPGG